MRILLAHLMVLAHIIADFSLQGILASMKQKHWWKENYPDHMYSEDWKPALIMHSVEWSILIILPYFVYMMFSVEQINTTDQNFIAFIFGAITVLNTVIHAWIDNMKANKHKINLIVDQCLHIIQLIVTESICNFVYLKYFS